MKEIDIVKKELKESGFEIFKLLKTSTFAFDQVINYETIIYINKKTNEVKLYSVADGDYINRMSQCNISAYINNNNNDLIDDLKRLYLLQNLNNDLSINKVKNKGNKI